MKTIVVKIGGSTLGSHDSTLGDLVALQKQGAQLVVVHGGGRTISEWLTKQGLPTRFVRGLRVTDAASLEVVVAVLAGLVNKELVSAINLLGGKAVGLSGVDGGLIEVEVRDPELGLVGEVTGINPEPVHALLTAGYMPVIASLGLERGSEDGKSGGTRNINADTVAGDMALALGAERLVFLTDVPGVCDQSGQLLPHLTPQQAQELVASGVVSGGMIPKVEACVKALTAVKEAQILDGRQAHALRDGLDSEGLGTTIKGSRT